MNDSWVTLQGWVGGEVTSRETRGGTVATFRLGQTPRYLKSGSWVDGQTNWFTVNVWRGLAENVARSVHKGDPVVVHGKLRIDVWEREGDGTSVRCVVEAASVGHDLAKGTSRFTRTARTEPRPTVEEDEGVKALVHGLTNDQTQLDSYGVPRPEEPRPSAEEPAA